ncbi:caspase family protein [filamentous cyanobacterium LEGE 11480]|uniref:Caspase family protein n=2 Tax=Romeriopsis TaxID=2992131 RepID=A0A928Z2W7_9CYAN|nr:caspase family protein [Romeriopsis navalis LEGE 11480]
MKRRAFLQSGAAYLTALGVGNLLLGNCQSVLAASDIRKIALLIGVDHYAQDALRGCITDVELQANLLTQRFGFAPENILRLTNQAATLDGIKQIFGSTLQQLQPNDVVFVHFSGKGAIGPAQQPALSLSGDESLLLVDLARLLNLCGSRKVITVLDTCYQSDGQPLDGNLRVRAHVADSAHTPVNIMNAGLPGIVLSAATTDQLAVEVDYPDFSAGRFTYGLTQSLWQTPTKSSLDESALGSISGGKNDRKLIDRLIATSTMPASIGALVNLDSTGTTGDLWLGGLPAEQVALVNPQALLKAGDGQLLKVQARQGLKAAVRVTGMDSPATPLNLGTTIAEQLRTMPRDLAIQIVIDHSLSKIERVDAIGALSGLANVSTKLIGDGAADYILAKVQEADPISSLVAALPDAPLKDVVPAPHYALFTADNQRISTTSGEAGEAVKTMVKRFAPIVEALYADKVLNLLENLHSANLAVSVESDRLTPQAKLFFRQSTALAQVKNTDMTTLPGLAAGTQLCYRATNQSNTPLYWMLVGWNSRHDTYVVLPPVDKESAVLGVGTTTSLPFRESGDNWSVRGPVGEATAYLVTSDRPFVQTTEVLKALNVVQPETYLHRLPQPLEVIQALLKDLSAPGFESSDAYGLDMNRYAVIPLKYQVA